MNPENETAPGEGRGEVGTEAKQRRRNGSKVDSASAMTHQAQAHLHARAAEIIAAAIFADRLASPEMHVLMESWRLIVEREAYFHERKAFKLKEEIDARGQLESVFDPEQVNVDELRRSQ